MYSINVFLTFSLSQAAMVRYWWRERGKGTSWRRDLALHVVGLVVCGTILVVNVVEKIDEGGKVTISVTTALVLLFFLIRRHYAAVGRNLSRLDDVLAAMPTDGGEKAPELDTRAQTAVLLVGSYAGLGVHSLLAVMRLFPGLYKNVVFISVGVVDSATFKNVQEVDEVEQRTRAALEQYVTLARRLGLAATYRMGVGTELMPEAERLCGEIAREFPRCLFFAGKLIFQRDGMWQRLLHNESAVQLQQQLQFAGLNAMVLPVRVLEGPVAARET